MSDLYSVNKKSTGVYCIKNIITGHTYVGSSVMCLYIRWKNHHTLLNTQKHRNNHLQNAVNKYGIKSFVFGVIDYFEAEDCLKMEQYYIDLLHPRYNISMTAGNTKGVKRSKESIDKTIKFHTGRKRSEESKDKMRLARVGMKLSEEHKKNIGLKSLGNKGHSHKSFSVISPSGEVFYETGVRPFCKKYNLNQGQFNQMILGKLKSCKGWKLAQ